MLVVVVSRQVGPLTRSAFARYQGEAHVDFLFAVGNRMRNPMPGAILSLSIVRPRDANRIHGAFITDNMTGSQPAVAQFLARAAGAMDTRYERNAVTQIQLLAPHGYGCALGSA